MVKTVKSICVYCGSADGLKQEYYDAAYHLGQLFANQNITLVYGAGKTGLMGAVANGVLDNNGIVIGVVPKLLNEPQLIHANLSKLEVLPDIHQRKARMSELADALLHYQAVLELLMSYLKRLPGHKLGYIRNLSVC